MSDPKIAASGFPAARFSSARPTSRWSFTSAVSIERFHHSAVRLIVCRFTKFNGFLALAKIPNAFHVRNKLAQRVQALFFEIDVCGDKTRNISFRTGQIGDQSSVKYIASDEN